jgi:ethanolaminephosphotransferase
VIRENILQSSDRLLGENACVLRLFVNCLWLKNMGRRSQPGGIAWMGDVLVYLLAVLTAMMGVLVFVGAFFPNKLDVRGSSQSNIPDIMDEVFGQSKSEGLGKHRILLMIVDALRSDFVYQNNSGFPFVMKKISKGEAFAYTTRAHAPTVTLPRLKAMITGDIPGFLDIVANFNSKELQEDNIISRGQRVGKRMLMFGDETWLKLFPSSFVRSDGTTAFYVMDTKIVDDNVTRHVAPELENQDWDLMILHYLVRRRVLSA